ncbi:MAG: glycosyl transferase, partial [Gemmatimonadales bacterium]|nr:glycosyl transferase [Gemmatimonadales bacterium]
RAAVRRARRSQAVTGRYVSAADAAYVRRAVALERPDVVLFDGIFTVCSGVDHPAQWIITHDVRYRRHAEMRRIGLNPVPYAFCAADEREVLEALGNVIAIQWDEAAEFRRLAPRARVVVVPVPFASIAPSADAERIEGRCLFVGSASSPNVDALQWFLDDCWPAIRARSPVATFDVCGGVCDRFGGSYERVRFLGTVDDLDASYRAASAVVIPLRAGSGLKVKLVEAMTHGCACVTSPVGAQGLGHIEPAPFALAGDAEAFARETVRIIEDRPWRKRLSEHALAAARRFHPDEAFAELEREIDSDAERARARSNDPRRICVGVPTYRRPEMLAHLLDGISAQTLGSTAHVEIAVFDNDPERSAEAVTRRAEGTLPFPVHYVPVPEPGLSMVRNAALGFALPRFDYLAMIDDDEFPEPQWLDALLRVGAELEADAVIGPVRMILPARAPRWIVQGNFFDLPMQRDRALLGEGYTGNCLLKLATIAALDLSFDRDCNLAGGEDQLFFRQLAARGGRIAFAAAAVASEAVLPERVCVRYLIGRHLRRGNSAWICDAKLRGTFAVMSIRAAKGAARIALGALVLVPRSLLRGRAGLVGSLCDIARGAGMLAGCFGIIVLAYKRHPSAAGTRPRRRAPA